MKSLALRISDKGYVLVRRDQSRGVRVVRAGAGVDVPGGKGKQRWGSCEFWLFGRIACTGPHMDPAGLLEAGGGAGRPQGPQPGYEQIHAES